MSAVWVSWVNPNTAMGAHGRIVDWLDDPFGECPRPVVVDAYGGGVPELLAVPFDCHAAESCADAHADRLTDEMRRALGGGS
jgi:hypothetical protein